MNPSKRNGLGQRLKKTIAIANPKLAKELELQQDQQQEPVTSKESEYWDKVYSKEPEQQLEVDKESCIELLKKLKKQLEAKINTRGENMQWQPVKDIYLRLVSSHYGIDLVEGYNSGKGLLIVGSVGTGKTEAFRHCRSVFLRSLMFNAKAAAKEVQKSNSSQILDTFAKPKALIIDDIGSEPAVNLYNNKVEVVADLIETDRYDLFISRGIKTYATTNLSGKDFFNRYDSRVLDRVKQMFNIYVLSNNKSFR